MYLLDTFGFECFHQNNLDQLYVNCLNEQLQYHYNQRMFAWEMVNILSNKIKYKIKCGVGAVTQNYLTPPFSKYDHLNFKKYF